MGPHFDSWTNRAVLRMSDSPPQKRAFFDTVQDYFLERTGRGLVLSSRDLELLLGWRNHGASSAVVCQGIDEAVSSLNKGPRDLHACKAYIEPKIRSGVGPVRRSPRTRTHADRAAEPVKNADHQLWSTAMVRLDQAASTAVRSELKTTYARARGRLQEAKAASADPYATLFEIEDWIVDAAFESLPEDERRLIDVEVDSKHGARLGMMSSDTRSNTVRATRREILDERFGLVGLVDM